MGTTTGLLSPEKVDFLTEVWGESFDSRIFSLGLTATYALAYIDANHNKVLTREKIAKFLDVSPDYLSRLFHQRCGVRLMEYIASYRVYLAQKQLQENPRMKVKDISLEVGIADIGYFCKTFKRHTGMTPKEFRTKSIVYA